MASTSSSVVMASSIAGDKACSSYDVFLSFSGEDTRYSFTDHLYHKLVQAGINTFRDNDGINKGEQLQPEFESAIKASRASIVVLSKSYASSIWCLDELVLILEQRKECNHFVLPVFYGVEPTDVRNQKGTFAIQVEPSSKWTDHNVSKWRTALREVADLAGVVVLGPETNILKEVVDTVYDKLDDKTVSLPYNITGMENRYKEISSWLEEGSLPFLAIYGIGGSGKTTLAKYIYNSNLKYFEYVSFVENIGSKCEEHNGLLELQQEQLMKDMSGGKRRTIPSVSRGTCIIAKELEMKKALIVLDDIVMAQLDPLLGIGKINEKSKIIITTREKVDDWPCWSYWRCQKYEMMLNEDEASELLCRHAFGSKIPMVGFENHVLQAVQYCQGNPLALELLGSSLFNKNIENWESQLRLLDRDIHSQVQDVLIRSYTSLPNILVKRLFLHIACFFTGKDADYVAKILSPDYEAISGIKTLIDKCLLSISQNRTLIMHRLVQEMGKHIVRIESSLPEKRSRVWLSGESYKILKKKRGSKTVEGLLLDMKMLPEDRSSKLNTDALNNMDSLKLLQLNFVELSGPYENFSEDLRWLCWLKFHLRTIPSDLCMQNLVAIDMSCSNLEVFDPPTVLNSLRILNLKDSHNLTEIRNISRIPHLETLVLWNCNSLVHVCEKIGDLTSLALLNMTGCNKLFNKEQLDLLSASTSGGVVTEQATFSFPKSLHQLFLKGCDLKHTDSFPLSFRLQLDLKYLNLGSSRFEFLPYYDHLKNLRVLDLSFCSRLKFLSLPSTLEELYIFDCRSLVKITFQSHCFTLQEFRYEGCVNLNEVEGFIKLVPIAKLDENDLGHLKWLQEYQKNEVRLVGDEITEGRSKDIQMLYEFGIMSTSLPNIEDPNMTPMYISESSSLSFDVPLCPENKRLKGINVNFKYELSGDDWVWFCKISTTDGVDLNYNPKVFGKPEVGEVCIWLSYWPIGDELNTGDKVNVSVEKITGLKVHQCGVSLVYADKESDDIEKNNTEWGEILGGDLSGFQPSSGTGSTTKNNTGWEDISGGDLSRFQSSTRGYSTTKKTNTGWEEILGGDLSGFQLSTGAYYLCRRDFFELMEVGKLTRDWFRVLVDDAIDHTEVRGWRKTGRPKQVNDPSVTELKFVRCIIHGPQLEDNYKIGEMSKSSIGDKTVASSPSQFYLRPPGSVSTSQNADYISSDVPNLNKRSTALRVFTLAELEIATNDFDQSNKIGDGRFGSVYLGIIKSLEYPFDAIRVAVKHGKKGPKVEQQWQREVESLGEIEHQNLVKLIGYCKEVHGNESILLLVYEYMPNRSLDFHLFRKSNTPLTWPMRLKIAQDAAIGLNYLHEGMGPNKRIVFRDFKPSNVLLDEDWNAKLSDLGFAWEVPLDARSHVSTLVVGTEGYAAPEYVQTGRLTLKIDVWSYGIFLEQLITGRSPAAEKSSARYPKFMRWLGAGKSKIIVDPRLENSYSNKSMKKISTIAEKCLVKDPKLRPTMSRVLEMVNKAIALQNQQPL